MTWISVIVPVYNNHDKLRKTFESINSQTLEKELYELIIVNDASTNPETIAFLHDLEAHFDQEINRKVVTHKTNQWLAAARNTGVQNSQGKYICSIDPGDYIAKDYLKKACLILEAYPNAAWVYPGVKRFGHVEKIEIPPDFNARKFFFDNFSVSSSVIRKEAYKKVSGQRKWDIRNNVRLYEDWDFLIRLMGKGYYGLPLKEPLFYYHQDLKSTMTRNWKDHLSSSYLVYFKNKVRFFVVRRAQKKYLGDIESHKIPRKLSVWPLSWIEIAVGNFMSKFLGHKIYPLSIRVLLNSVFTPGKFISNIYDHKILPTKAAQIEGFISMPTIKHDEVLKSSKTMFFVQTHWKIGGAEKVFLDWLKNIRPNYDGKIVNVGIGSKSGNNQTLFSEFESNADEIYEIRKLSHTPLSNLKLCWQLLIMEKPETLFIYHNPYFYILTPYIKKYLTDCKIVDILHVEDNEHPGYFEIADEYKEYIDQRVVISDYWKEVLTKRYGEDPAKVKVVYNNIDLNRFDPDKYNKQEVRKSMGYSVNDRIVGFIGRFNKQKQPLVFINLAKRFLSDKRYRFLMIGDGELRDSVEKEASQCPNIQIITPTSEPQWFYSLCDILIFPSLFEGYPLVGLEAAAMNTPILATDVVGFREQIQEGEFGKLIAMDEEDKMLDNYYNLVKEEWDELMKKGSKGSTYVNKRIDSYLIHQQQLELFIKKSANETKPENN